MEPRNKVQSFEDRILEFGRELLERMGDAVPGVFDLRRLEGRVIEWAMRDPQFKIDLFRLVELLPSLKSTGQIADHTREYLMKKGESPPGIPPLLAKAASASSLSWLLAKAVDANVKKLARRFIIGVDAAEVAPKLESLHREGFAFTVDLLGEQTLSDAEADVYAGRYLSLIEELPGRVVQWPDNELIDYNHLGRLPRANVSLKVSSMDPNLDPLDTIGGVERLKARIIPLLLRARELGVSVHFDLEHWGAHEITFNLFEDVACSPELRGYPYLGMTLQAYLKQSDRDLERLLSIARSRGTHLGVRLAKGAYWDSELVRARQFGFPCPVFTEKRATDARFEELTDFLIRNSDHFHAKFASHNLRSLVYAIVSAGEAGLPPNAIEAQTLYGMAEPERAALKQMGHRVRVYAPVGEPLPGMAYLVRRLLENTSNQGFLRLTHREHTDPTLLFAPTTAAPSTEAGEEENAVAATPGEDLFVNTPLTDWTDPEARDRMRAAVAHVEKALPLEVYPVVDGIPLTGARKLEHPCPSRSNVTATSIVLTTVEDADRAVVAAAASFPAWRDTPLSERTGLLEKLADGLERDRFHLAALQTWETGKPWREADADVAEAIDFCRYYAKRAPLELGVRSTNAVPGERNRTWYEGRGVTTVIAPWNFPLAILTGMTAGALVAGNTVVMKPAEQSSGVAQALFDRLVAANFPDNVVHFLPGLGEEVGSHLARHPKVATIAFTGSRAVGLSLVETAGRTMEGQECLKRVVVEMGGKNAVVVDEDADLDAAVFGVVVGGFGYSGQKCSACSRVITVGNVHEGFAARLVAAAKSLMVGGAEDPATFLGPVIDREAVDRLKAAIATDGPGVRHLYSGPERAGGNFVPPSIFEVTDPAHPLMREELFGPVVALYRAESLEEAIEVANSTDYALTGAVYSRSPSHLELAEREFRVGNLYLNRTCTGAMVGRQPFGGFRMSGGGTKAGGPGYLLNFADPRTATENTTRRGFTPEVQV